MFFGKKLRYDIEKNVCDWRYLERPYRVGDKAKF